MNEVNLPESTFTGESSGRKSYNKLLSRGLIVSDKNEPIYDIIDVDADDIIKYKMIKIFNWYSIVKDTKIANKWIIDYVKLTDKKLASLISTVSTVYYSNTAGWIARLILRGNVLPEKYVHHLNTTINRMERDSLRLIESKKNNKKKTTITSISSLNEKKILDKCKSEIDYQIDCFITTGENATFDIELLLKENCINFIQATDLIDYINKNYLCELKNISRDDELKEAYSNYSLDLLNKLISFLISLNENILKYIVIIKNVKKIRKPRKKKVRLPSEQVKKLFYCLENFVFNLKSIDPKKIIGATQLWVFNIKYRNLGVYYSNDGGFLVKGSTIKNFNKDLSIEKKLRKPNEILSHVLTDGRVVLKKIMSSINCKHKLLTGRINKHTILLRVL